jgi:alkanesulfonate monooxygenase SsuD/methylene tetrahydromethanopterin reductase-like flavin-dependent oxidoreductase (luciferase family)
MTPADVVPVQLGLHLWAQGTSWELMRGAALRAEACGYRYVFTWDHLYAIFGDPRGPALEGWTLLAALAEATHRVRLGLLVTANPFRNPGVVAKMAATVADISQGRLILGMGSAWYGLEHRAHGIDFGASPGERLDWLEESIRAIRALLGGERVTSDTGSHYAFADAAHAPNPRIPLLVGGGGERRTLRIVARYADMWNVMGTPDVVRRKRQVLDDHCVIVGRRPTDIERSVTVRAIVRDRAEDAAARWQDLLAANGAAGIEYLTAITGDPPHVAEALRAYVGAGVQTIVVELPPPYDAETIERLAVDVAPLI